MSRLRTARAAEPGLNERRRIRLARILDRCLGSLLIPLWASCFFSFSRPRSRVDPPGGVKKILFIKLWGVGSITLSEPALRRLQARHPGVEIHYLTLERNAQLFELIPSVSHVHTLAFRSLIRLAAQTLGLIGRLRQERYDEIFDAEFFVNFSALLARAAGGRVSGFASPSCFKRRIQDRSIPLDPTAHASTQFLQLVQPARSSDRAALLEDGLDLPLAPVRPRLRLPVRSVDRGLRSLGGAPFYPFRTRYWVLNINASSLALERRWPRNRFLRLSRELLEIDPCRLVLIGSGSEQEYVAELERELAEPDRVVNLCGCLSLSDLAQLLSRARFLISNDSGPVHLASALDLPVIAFYGPETPLRYGPLSAKNLVLYEKPWCSPCMKPENGKSVRCVNSLACMKLLTSELVSRSVRAFLQQHGLVDTWEEQPEKKISARG